MVSTILFYSSLPITILLFGLIPTSVARNLAENGMVCSGKNEEPGKVCNILPQPSCDDPGPEPTAEGDCISTRDDCVCLPRYIRADPRGQGPCVPEEECKKPLIMDKEEGQRVKQNNHSNASFFKLGPAKQHHVPLECHGEHEVPLKYCNVLTQPSCDQPKPKIIFSAECVVEMENCICLGAYIRAGPKGQGPCIPRNECPKKLGNKNNNSNAESPHKQEPIERCGDPNALVKQCVYQNRCLPTCKTPNPNLKGCWGERECKFLPMGRCVCREGYVSANDDGNGPCVKLEECQNGEEEEGSGQGNDEAEGQEEENNNKNNGQPDSSPVPENEHPTPTNPLTLPLPADEDGKKEDGEK